MVYRSGLTFDVFPIGRSLNVFEVRRYLSNLLPPNSVFWSGDWFDIFLAKFYGFETQKIDRGGNVSGKMIRRNLLQDDNIWESYVNPQVAELVREGMEEAGRQLHQFGARFTKV